jgi:parallel beta-helix repeat protein
MKFSTKPRWLLLPLSLLAVFPVFAGPPQAVTECETIITEPGKYRLRNDLVDCEFFGVNIHASDVTLDLNGHTISCEANENRTGGVLTALTEDPEVFFPVSGVTVMNGTVTGCSDGILLALAEDSKVTKMTSWGNRLWNGVSGTGITVWLSQHNVIMHNHVYANEDVGIFSWIAGGNLYKHNTATGNFMGIRTGYDDNAEILCNQVHGNALGIALGPASTDSLVRGNLVADNFYEGISVVGIVLPPEEEDGDPDVLPFSAGNTIRSNLVEGNNNGVGDLFEGYWNFLGGEIPAYQLHPDGCMNTWKKNQYGSAYAPDGCIGPSVVLEEDDICALDED